MAQRMYLRLDGGALEPGEFRVSEGDMGARRIEIACPKCGHVSELLQDPRLRWPCASESCSFTEFLILSEVIP